MRNSVEVSFFTHIRNNGYLWAIQSNSNLLLMIDENNLKVLDIVIIPNEPDYYRRPEEEKLFIWKDRLYIFLYGSGFVHVYNIKYHYFLDDVKLENNYVLYQECFVQVSRKIYILPGWKMPFMVFDCESCMIDIVNKEHTDNMNIAACYENIEGSIYAVDRFIKCIYKVEINSKTINIFPLEELTINFGTFRGVKKISNKYYLPLLDKVGMIILDCDLKFYNYIKEIDERIFDGSDLIYSQFGVYREVLKYDEWIILIPLRGTAFAMYNCKERHVVYIPLFDNKIDDIFYGKSYVVESASIAGDELLLFGEEGKWFRYKIKTGKKDYAEIIIESIFAKDYFKYLEKIKSQNNDENYFFKLEDYLKVVIRE